MIVFVVREFHWIYQTKYAKLVARSDNMEQFQRISHDIGIMGGKACITGTRITVGVILTLISEGATIDEILTEYPCLTAEDVAEALIRGTLLSWRIDRNGNL